MKRVLFYLWQLPQNLIGLVLVFICYLYKNGYTSPREPYTSYRAHIYYTKLFRGAISLGDYIIIGGFSSSIIIYGIIKHEAGHCIQSRILGPLYLVVIGLPSIIAASTIKSYSKYKNFYTEKWANKLSSRFDHEQVR